MIACYLLLCLLLIEIAVARTIRFNDGEIRYFGRWQKTVTDMRSISSGAYLKTIANDDGEVRLKLSQPATLFIQMNKNRQLIRRETSDHGSFFQIQIEHVAANTTLTIVSDLNSTICLQEIEMVSHQQTDSTHTYRQQQQQQQPLIEFVGHDLTLGLGTSQLLMTSFPWIVSDMLDTERSQIASPKAWLMDHQELLGMETLYFIGDSFYAPPHIITILLGEYDDHHYPEAGPMYTRRLFMFLSNIRYRFPHAFIIVLSEPLGVLFQESQKAVYLMSDADENIAFVDTTGWIRYGPTHYTNPVSALFMYRRRQFIRIDDIYIVLLCPLLVAFE